MIDVASAIFIVGVIMLLAFLGDWIFKKTDIPSVVWLLIFGLVLGPILNLVNGESFLGLSQYIGAIAITIILFDGGMNLDLENLIKGAPRGLLLSIVSFVISVATVTVIMNILGNSIINGILLGAIIGGTSSPIVIPIARKLRSLKDRSKAMMLIESAITDPLCIVVVIALMFMITAGAGIEVGLQSLVTVFSIGAILGILAGFIWLPLMHAIRKEEFAYVLTLGVSLLIYASTSMVVGGAAGIGAGAIAVLLFGIVLGNGKKIIGKFTKRTEGFEIDKTTKEFHNLITFFMRTFFFVYLGMIVSFTNIDFIFIGIVLALGLVAIRPLAVKIATFGSKFEKGEKQIMSLLIPRGLAAAVLAYIPISYYLPNTNGFVDIAFTVILTTTIVATIGVALINHIEKRKNYA